MYGPAGERRLTEYEVPLAARLRGLVAGAGRQRGLRAVPARRLRRGDGRDPAGARRRDGRPRADAAGAEEPAALPARRRGSEPDEGIWEVRGPRRHFTHSKVMAWVAFDRAVTHVRALRAGGAGRPLARRRGTRSTARSASAPGTRERNSFTQSYGSTTLDAALLLIPMVGFLPPDDPRVDRHGRGDRARADARRLRAALPDRAGRRRPAAGGEGAFLPCTFWLVNNLALLGPPRRGRRAVRAAARPRATTSACSPRSTTRSAGARSATSRRRSPTSGSCTRRRTCEGERREPLAQVVGRGGVPATSAERPA